MGALGIQKLVHMQQQMDILISLNSLEIADALGMKIRVQMQRTKERHYDILKWARDHGCPWGSRTTEFVAYNEYYDILKMG